MVRSGFGLTTGIAVALALMLSGCGGEGGTFVPSGGTGGTTAFTLGASVKMNGGQLQTGTAPPMTSGTYTFALRDNSGNTTTFPGVYLAVPSTFTTYNIMRAGSKLFDGTYSSQVAIVHDQAGHQGTISLNPDGTLAEDVATTLGQQIVLPVVSDGPLQFQGGITVSPNITVSNNTQDVLVTLTTAQATLQSGSFAGALSLSGGGTPNTFAKVELDCQGASSLNPANLFLDGTTVPPSKSAAVQGTVSGSNLVYVLSTFTINVDN